MSEVHHPLSHPKSLGGLILELFMISVAVFLGLFADQWRENRHLEESAKSALVNFRAEMVTNRQLIVDRQDYHKGLAKTAEVFVSTDGPHDLKAFMSVTHFHGVRPITFEHTAWDLALSTQALAHVPSDLAYEISRVYTHQASYQTYENSFIAALLAPGTLSGPDVRPAAVSIGQFLGDAVYAEPEFMKDYDELVPRINVALGQTKP
jgi:hypothetical protein